MGLRFVVRLGAAVALLGLSACGGGEGNASGLACKSLAPLVDGSNNTNNCAAPGGCSVERPADAADGNFGSAATLLQKDTTSGFVAVEARASGGGTFAAGTLVGVIWESSAAMQTGASYQLNTYRLGALQDSFVLATDSSSSPARSIAYTAQTATLPYDTVEFRVIRASGTTTGTAKVYEFCN